MAYNPKTIPQLKKWLEAEYNRLQYRKATSRDFIEIATLEGSIITIITLQNMLDCKPKKK